MNVFSSTAGYAKRQFVEALQSARSDRFLLQYLNRRGRQSAPRCIFGQDSATGLYFAKDSHGQVVFVPHRDRLILYVDGISTRIDRLLNSYGIPKELLRPGDTVVDCGANCGEIGMWSREFRASYLGFEPDPFAFQALKATLPGQNMWQVALSDKNGSQRLFVATESADSSLIPTARQESDSDVFVTTSRLDDFPGLSDASIRLLKVEAEGGEPEVLAGAMRTLARTQFVALDAGPERAGESPAPECLNVLYDEGFRLLNVNLNRGTFFLSRNPGEPVK